MKTKEEIVQLVNTFWFNYRYDNGYKLTGSLTHMGEKDMLVKLYTQCQEDMQKDVEYWQGESDHWHQQAMDISNKYNELLNKQDNE